MADREPTKTKLCPYTYYPETVETLREREYPLLRDVVYLDHAGTTLYARSLIESFSHDLTSNLFGNPHSASASSQLTSQRVDDIRLRLLHFFDADPGLFDLVFVANATAGIKLVADALRDSDPSGFWYGYHAEAHTSLIGVRELTDEGSRCFLTDKEVDDWIAELPLDNKAIPKLFAFPAQSNMTGRRLPLKWCGEIRKANRKNEQRAFTLLDAAGFVSTAPLNLGDASSAPDFVVLSFYKIFGFPDLGALIIRKDSGYIFRKRRYFGGGTVDMVLALGDQWHAKKTSSLHGQLEDGTLPFHDIIALDSAVETHIRLYGSMANISSHTRLLAKKLFDRLSTMVHHNGLQVCRVYGASSNYYTVSDIQGPVIAFNLRNCYGDWVGKSEVERLASVKNIHLRSGTLCNPGGMASYLELTHTEMRQNFRAGQRCGDDHDIMNGKPTGALRVSLGAMSSMTDIETFINFVEEYYVDKAPVTWPLVPTENTTSVVQSTFFVESLCVYPIKSCGSFKVPSGSEWKVGREGLAWDREWCLIHQGTGVALSQKKYPRMALIRPYIDFSRHVLRITCCGTSLKSHKTLEISLMRSDSDLVLTELCSNLVTKSSTICGDQVIVQTYSSPDIVSFFSDFLKVPCILARLPPRLSPRYSNVRRLNRIREHPAQTIPGSFPEDPAELQGPILLSNESPVLLISRSSVDRLNEDIKVNSMCDSGISRAVVADVFRANIIVAERSSSSLESSRNAKRPYIEDTWTSLRIGPRELAFDVLGSCQRCQMVCVDQFTALRSDEPFSTLAKTRKIDRKIVFGRHIGLSAAYDDQETITLKVGDTVTPFWGFDEHTTAK